MTRDGRRAAGPHPLVVFLIAAFLILPRLDTYGMTFDEARIMDDARALIAWLGGVAETREVWFGLERPSPAKVLAASGLILFDRFDPLVAIRVFPALFYALAASLLYAGLRRPRGAFAAAAAAGAMLLAPPLFGLSAQASNESVLASLTIITLVRALAARTPREWALVGVVAGVAIGTKVTGLVLVVALMAWVGLIHRERMTWGAVAAFFGALVAGFLLTWPPLLLHPSGVLEHVAIFARMERPPLLYFGLQHDGAPWHYAPVWLLIGVPPLVLLFALIEIGRVRPLSTLLVTYLIIGLLAAIGAHAVLREGVRHLLPLVIVLAAASGLGLGRLAELFPRRRLLFLLLLFLPLLVFDVRHHPAEAFYVSEAIGGPSGAARRGLPITSSGDLMNDAVLARLPAGRYAVLPGPSADRPLNFAAPRWRVQLGERASRITGRSIVFTSGELADHLVVLGAESTNGATISRAGLALVERGGVVQAALIRNPSRRAD